MIAIIRIFRKDGTYFNSGNVFEFSYVKEAYTPYSYFNVTFDADEMPDDEYISARFNVNYKNISQGAIDTLKVVKENGKRIGHVTARSYTSMLLENQLPPGMYSHLTINSLVDDYFSIPNITHEDNSAESYIYVKKGSSMWDGVVNLSYKLTGRYPYIRSENKIMISDPEKPLNLTFTNNNILSVGSEMDTRRLVSSFHMADIEGNYGTYDLTNPDAAAREIVRNRYFDLDRRFLYDPLQGCQFRDAIANRIFKRKFFSYAGYEGEDLGDRVSFGDVVSGRVSAVRITGNIAGIITEVSVYEDSFNPV